MENQCIYKALASINKEIKAIGKDRKNEQQNFKFRGIDDVMNELHDLFAKNEVIILPEIINSERTERTNNKGTTIFSILVTICFHFVANDGSRVSVSVIGEAMDSGDKCANKAMSIGLKYALLQMFLIPTEDAKDPDAETHEVKSKYNPTEDLTKKKAHLDQAIKQVRESKTISELQALWSSYPDLQKTSGFLAAKEAKKIELSNTKK